MRPSSRTKFVLTVSTFGLVLAACGRDGFSPAATTDLANNGKTAQPSPVPTPSPRDESLAICSTLSLKDVVWPSALDVTGKRSIALGLNISGSFEGGSGWKNITNNFDGQGLSLGLLNQCLGQGSLQPLMVKMRDRNGSILKDLFSSAHYTSFTGMLAKFQGTAKVASFDIDEEDGLGDETMMPDGRLSPLDSLPEGSDGIGNQETSASDSVAWAKSNLYTDGGTTFQSVWKKEMQAMSGHPAYVSIQIEAALKIHNRALAYMKTLGLRELRSYLTLFDICVQNGSLATKNITDYNAAFPKGSTATETTRLTKIVELRVVLANPKYQADVRARKMSIVNGTGVVHGSSRNYGKEYCFTASEKIL